MFLTAWLTKSSTLSRGSLLNATASAQTRSVVRATFYWASETRLYYRTNLCNFGEARVGIARSSDGLLLAAVDAASPMPQKKASGAWLESTGASHPNESTSRDARPVTRFDFAPNSLLRSKRRKQFPARANKFAARRVGNLPCKQWNLETYSNGFS
jgi:hypothetical protein